MFCKTLIAKSRFRSIYTTAAIFCFVIVLSRSALAQRKYDPTWESLAQRELSRWLLDAKFGIYAHWGIYSVPAYRSEWYAKRMYDKNDSVYKHHVKTYGDPSKFGNKDFIPMFKAEKYDPNEWADLIAASGAKYAGIAVVHHDGFMLWHSKVNRWNAGNMGPKRDLYGELVRSLRRKPGMKVIATFHHIRTFDWHLPNEKKARDEAQKAGCDLFDPKYADLYWNQYTGKYEDFIAEWKAKVREVIDKYQPDILWFDGGKFQDADSQHHVTELLSYYFNRAEQWGSQVEVLNKLPMRGGFNFPRDFGVLTFEEGRDRPAVLERPWIDDQPISNDSWCYIQGQTYKSASEILHGLIDRVSRGGGLLLSLCPKADGTINAQQQQVLLSMGQWLTQNGQAIYGTRPWKIHAEGPVDKLQYERRGHSRWRFKNCNAEDIRFTCKENTLYAITLGRPNGNKLSIKTLGTGTHLSSEGIDDVSLLGSNVRLRWWRNAEALIIELPTKLPNDIALAFAIRVKGTLEK